MAIRRARLAGSWYSSDEASCRQEIEDMVRHLGPSQTAAFAGIVPHAGWAFSGSAAARVLRAVAALEPRPELLILFGTHLGPHGRGRICRADGFETPLGQVRADPTLAARLADELGLVDDPADESDVDNTVEVQLPLIKHLLPEAQLLVVGPPASRQALEIGKTVARAARDTNLAVAVVGSTDLTHYGPNYGFNPQGHGEAAVRWVKEVNDKLAVERMLALDPAGVIDEAMAHSNACCPGAAAAALAAAQELGATKATLLDYCTSYDVRPGPSFVGYAGIAINR